MHQLLIIVPKLQMIDLFCITFYSFDGRQAFVNAIAEHFLRGLQAAFHAFFLGEADGFLGHDTVVPVLVQGFHCAFIATEKQFFDLRHVVLHATVSVKLNEEVRLGRVDSHI